MQKYYKNQFIAILYKLSNYLKTIKMKVCTWFSSFKQAPSKPTTLSHTPSSSTPSIDENTVHNFGHFRMQLNMNPSGFIYDELEPDTDHLNNKLDNNVENNIIIINLSHPDITYEVESHNKLPADAIDKELKNLLIPFPSSTRIH